jgi:hypothetical protein
MTQSAVIDLGYYTTKIFQQSPTTKLISFRSKIQKSKLPIKYHNTHHITLDNTDYIIGNSAETIDINLDKSHSTLHLLTTLTGLGLLNSGTYNLIANIPLNYFNKTNKQSLENHLTISKTFILNNITTSITIQKCIVFPQTLSVLYVNKTPSLIGIIDIGGLTCQSCICENLNIIQSTISSTNLGTLILFDKIKKQLNSIYNLDLKDYEIDNIFHNGLLSKPESLKIIESICIQHVEQIIKSLKLSGWNIESIPILLTGGGSLLLEKYLYKVLPTYKLSSDPINDNCKGLWEVSKYVFN